MSENLKISISCPYCGKKTEEALDLVGTKKKINGSGLIAEYVFTGEEFFYCWYCGTPLNIGIMEINNLEGIKKRWTLTVSRD